MNDMNHFFYYDASVRVNPIVMKLPYNLQEKWTNTAVKYTNEHNAVYPSFHVFVRFVQEQSRIKNNPTKAERVLTRKNLVQKLYFLMCIQKTVLRNE